MDAKNPSQIVLDKMTCYVIYNLIPAEVGFRSFESRMKIRVKFD